ncbi:methyl-accepting chemotaxis protein [Tepiditoga spiralis]|uniref:Methyl-accepting chemotaxis protein n=1 Tax=Tepiditoga spiralis TaxID=2108365 RepID=A0A7G1G4U8_9BACT|nr:methyl-accepting chemotaxis protein [Tepiditoga spiralis]BBE30044.1 methyl-accepting chemotaxis protein [Tepiditoga spiralis]
MKLKGKLISFIVGTITVFFILIMYNNVASYQTAFKKAKHDIMLSNTNIVNSFEAFFNNVGNIANFLNGDANVLGAYENKYEERKWMLKTFQNIVDNYAEIEFVYMGLPDGTMITTPPPVSSDYDPRVRPWYKDALEKNGEIVITDPYADSSSGEMLITVTKAIIKNGEVVGVIGLDLNMNELVTKLNESRIYKSQYSYVLNEKGITLLHKDATKIGKDMSTTELYKKATSNSGVISYVYNKVKKTAYYQKMNGTNWIFYTVVDDKDVAATPVRRLIINFTIAVTLSIIVLVMVLYFLSKMITKPLKEMSEKIERFGNGEINEKFEYESKDEIGQMSKALKRMTEKLREIIMSIDKSGSNTERASSELSSVSEELSATAEELTAQMSSVKDNAENVAANVEEVSSGVQEVAASAQAISRSAQELSEAAEESSIAANEGSGLISDVQRIINEALTQSDQTNKEVNKLSENAANVENIVDTINSITEQTNLLALNAAIEAARAGEAGKGFAVVAEEIRKLAEESKNATEKIAVILGEIKTGTETTAGATEKIVNITKKINGSMKELTEKFEVIKERVDGMNSGIQNLTASSEQQSASAEEMSSAMDNVARIVSEISDQVSDASEAINNVSEGTQNITANAGELLEMSKLLISQIKFFKL